MNKIRSISYSHDRKSTIRRQVGHTLDVKVDGGSNPITITEIVLVNKPGRDAYFAIYGTNQHQETGLWKEVPSNIVEVEYDINDLLNDA